jgi:hypothetical protein
MKRNFLRKRPQPDSLGIRAWDLERNGGMSLVFSAFCAVLCDAVRVKVPVVWLVAMCFTAPCLRSKGPPHYRLHNVIWVCMF